jgi:hypothetical protein
MRVILLDRQHLGLPLQGRGAERLTGKEFPLEASSLLDCPTDRAREVSDAGRCPSTYR